METFSDKEKLREIFPKELQYKKIVKQILLQAKGKGCHMETQI